MKLWSYYAWHTFINTIKKIFRSTVLIVILAVFGFGLVGGLVGSMIGSVVGSEESTEISSEFVEEEMEEEEEAQEEMSPQEVAMVKTLAEGALGLIFLIVLLWGLYSGSKKGTEIFQMADVNFLFTAPLKPQSVLMFRLTFQMAATIVGSVYLVFQIPNLVINVGLGAAAIAAVFVGWIMLCIVQRLMMVLSYTVFTTHEKLKKYVVPGIWTIAAVIVLTLAAVFMAAGRDPYRMVQLTFGSGWSRLIPVIGWYKGMVMCAVNGQVLLFLVYLALMLAAVGLLVFAIWHIRADFYEDAFSAASKYAEVMEAAKEGRKVRVKERSRKISRTGTFGGEGASVFFTKEIYSRRRMAKLGFITNTMIFYMAVNIVMALLTLQFMESHSFLMSGIILMLVLFFRNFGNPIARETSMNWLFLVPDNPYKKVFYAMLAGTYSCTIDLIPGLVVSTILIGENPLLMLLWLLTLVVVDFMLSCVGVLLEALFPASALDVAKSMIQMLLRFFIIMILTVFMTVGYLFGGVVGALVMTTVASAAVGGILFIIYPSMLHSGYGSHGV